MLGEADIDVFDAIAEGRPMKRFYPLLLIVVCAGLFVGGVLWKMTSANECWDQGGTVAGPMTRNQDCATIH